MTMNADTLDWPVMILAGVDADFTVEEPAELRDLAAARRQPVSAGVVPRRLG